MAVVLWAHAVPNQFVLDAERLIRDDPRVRSLDVAGIFGSDYWRLDPSESAGRPGNLWRPIPVLLWSVLWNASDGSPSAFNLAAILLHGVACAARSVLVLLLLADSRIRRPVALMSGLALAAHGAASEVVLGMVGMAESLSTLLATLSWIAFLGFRRSGRRRLLGASALAFAAALLCKENVAVLPALFVLQDLLLPGGRRPREEAPRAAARLRAAALCALPFAAVLGAWVGLRIVVIGGFAPAAEDQVFFGFAFADRLKTMMSVLSRVYVPGILAPFRMPPQFTHQDLRPPDSFFDPAVLLGFVVLAGLLVQPFLFARRRPELGVLAALLPLGLLPVSNLVAGIGAIAAYRFLYFPLPGLVVPYTHLLVRWIVRPSGRHPARRAVAFAALAAFLAIQVASALPAPARWRTPATLYAYAVESSPESVWALYNLGNVAIAEGRHGAARALYERATRIRPAEIPGTGRWHEDTRETYFTLHMNLGTLLLQNLNDRPAALRAFGEAVRFLPEGRPDLKADALCRIGMVSLPPTPSPEELAYPRSCFEEAVRAAPGDAAPRAGLALVARLLGRTDDVARHLEAAESLEPGDPVYLSVAMRLARERSDHAAFLRYFDRTKPGTPQRSLETIVVAAEAALRISAAERARVLAAEAAITPARSPEDARARERLPALLDRVR